MGSPVDIALADLARVLARLSVDWYLFGAQAAILYGSARVTEDIDITIALGHRTPRELVTALTKHGFRTRVRDSAGFVERTRVLPVVHTRTRMPVDIVFAGPGLEEEFMARRSLLKRGRTTVPVVSPEDLVVLKILAGRPRDEEDVRAVLRAKTAELDRERIKETLSALETALGQSDLLPAFTRLTREARAKRTARARPVKRGSGIRK
jgi:hypothetical protein